MSKRTPSHWTHTSSFGLYDYLERNPLGSPLDPLSLFPSSRERRDVSRDDRSNVVLTDPSDLISLLWRCLMGRSWHTIPPTPSHVDIGVDDPSTCPHPRLNPPTKLRSSTSDITRHKHGHLSVTWGRTCRIVLGYKKFFNLCFLLLLLDILLVRPTV